MARKVFYSWQSDLPNSTNRSFILRALKAACTTVGEDLSVDERPEVDRDTQGVPGAPDIPATIFAKIDAADVFVADISIITASDAARACPNPNVLIELGYAIKTLDWHKIIPVMNISFGGPELLPFDLKTKRVMTYRVPEEGVERAPERKKLQGSFTDALRSILKHPQCQTLGVEIKPASLAELACRAVEEGKPSATAAIRRFIDWLGTQLDSLSKNDSTALADDLLVQAIEATKPLVIEFVKVADVIASHDVRDSARALFKGFEVILAGYDIKPGFSGGFNRGDFDLHKFVGYELLVILTAILVREDRWEILTDVLGQNLIVKSTNGTPPVKRFDALSDDVLLLRSRKERLKINRISLFADILKERYEDGDLGKLVTFEQFKEADFLLYLRGELEARQGNQWRMPWRPWSAVFLARADPPRYLLEATSKTFAKRLALALGVSDEAQLRERLAALKPQQAQTFGDWWAHRGNGPLGPFDPGTIGMR